MKTIQLTLLMIVGSLIFCNVTKTGTKTQTVSFEDLIKECKYERIISITSETLSKDSTIMDAYKYRGMAYYYLKNYYSSINDLNHYLKESPKNPQILLLRSVCYLNETFYTKALEDLNGLDSSNMQVLWNKALCYKGLDVNRTRHWGLKAIAFYTKAINLDTSVAQLYYERGMLYYERSEVFKDAINRANESDYLYCDNCDSDFRSAYYKAYDDFVRAYSKDSTNLDCLFQIASVDYDFLKSKISKKYWKKIQPDSALILLISLSKKDYKEAQKILITNNISW